MAFITEQKLSNKIEQKKISDFVTSTDWNVASAFLY